VNEIQHVLSPKKFCWRAQSLANKNHMLTIRGAIYTQGFQQKSVFSQVTRRMPVVNDQLTTINLQLTTKVIYLCIFLPPDSMPKLQRMLGMDKVSSNGNHYFQKLCISLDLLNTQLTICLKYQRQELTLLKGCM
jgi:hypothetical protein